MAGYLARQQHDPNAMVAASEVESYEAAAAQAVDPRVAWDGACEALGDCPAFNKPAQLPTGWATLLAGANSMTGLPMAAGNFPQLVRDWLPMVDAASLHSTLSANGAKPDVAGLQEWIEGCARTDDPGRLLLAVGLLRLTKRYESAAKLLSSQAPAKNWKTAFANEQAACLWHSGDHAAARKLWASLPDTAATQFNRGMSELFSDNAKAAVPHLKAVAAKLPESSGWHHLGMLYLALAQSR